MSTYTQQGRWLSLQTPLGEDELLLRGVTGKEELSRLYMYELEMVSLNANIDPSQIIGKNVRFVLKNLDDSIRYFHGYVSRFTCRGTDDRLSIYVAEVVPWTWFLTQTRDCRIFQNKTIPDIIKQVLANYISAEYELKLGGSYPAWEYCVQYRESDFDFISRLMEQAGIYYYFRHEEDRHVMVLADSRSAYQNCAEAEVTFADNLSGGDLDDKVLKWEHSYTFRPSKASETDYNFEKPSASLRASTNTILPLDGAPKTELYDFPGRYAQKPEGDAQIRVRMEEVEAAYDVVHGQSKCRTFFPGGRFTLTHHHSDAESGKQYVLTSVQFEAHQSGAFVTSKGKAQKEYENSFTCIPATITYRPDRRTPKPVIKGIQTATVVGPAGQEIHCDKYGRVKVQFHWDREGKKDDKSSCWIRVAQASAGAGFGAVVLPRITQEVVVQFLEGDPDRPIITGCVYNAEQMPPYTLPENKTRWVFKSNSTTGGGGFNELRFEDKKGQEHIFIHAEKDQDIRVKNDTYEWIGRDRHLIVKRDQIEHVENNRSETVDADHMEKIGKDRHLQIEGKEAKEITGSQSLVVNSDVIEVFKANHSEQTTANYYLKADNIVIEALTNLTIKVGQTYIALESSGIKIGTTGTIELESIGETTIKGTAGLTAQSPAQVQVKAGGIMTVQGSMVKIN